MDNMILKVQYNVKYIAVCFNNVHSSLLVLSE